MTRLKKFLVGMAISACIGVVIGVGIYFSPIIAPVAPFAATNSFCLVAGAMLPLA